MESNSKVGLFAGSFVALIVVGLFLLLTTFGTVGAGEIGVKTRFGAVVGQVDQGLYFKLPIFEKVRKFDVRTRVIKNEHYVNESGKVISDNALEAASKDLQDVQISIVVNYSVDQTKVMDLFNQYKTLENYEEGVIKPLIKEVVKGSTAQYTAEELVTKRAEFSANTSELLRKAISEKGAIFERNNITNIGFSESFTKAIEAKVTAEQEALTAKNKLEQVKFEAQQQIESAKAQAETIRIQAQAITQQGGKEYVNLKAVEKWNGALPAQMIPGSALPFINLTK